MKKPEKQSPLYQYEDGDFLILSVKGTPVKEIILELIVII